MDMVRERWSSAQTRLCVGLDTDLQKIPSFLKNESQPLFQFNKQIIDATHDLVCAYKPQIAYYAAQKAENELVMTIEYIKKNYPKVPVILDSKRGDIGDTAEFYAREAFDVYGAHAVTVNPYMGGDTLKPFLNRKDKGIIILCKTSNSGSAEFQNLTVGDGKTVYEHVATQARKEWNGNENVALVVGATHIEDMSRIRQLAGDLPFLVPGVGAQGGDAKQVIQHGRDSKGQGLIINSSRGIIYASNDQQFAERARQAAQDLCSQMK